MGPRVLINGIWYKAHKATRFRQGDEPDVTKNEAFILSNAGPMSRRRANG
jgi:hypothetical protein